MTTREKKKGQPVWGEELLELFVLECSEEKSQKALQQKFRNSRFWAESLPKIDFLVLGSLEFVHQIFSP